MSEVETSWQGIASTLGFDNEKAMLAHLYSEQGMSISEIAKVVGYSTWSVRRRLLVNSVILRGRGGSHHQGFSKLSEVDLIELFETKIAELVFKYDVHAATVANERRRRREEYAAFLSNLSNKPVKQADPEPQPSHGVSSVPVEGPTISELLQDES